MSTIKANAYLDAAGGNNATINGITPALASQAQAQAGTDNTTLMTPLRAADAITAQVGTATADLSAGGVGTYIWAVPNNTTDYAANSTIAGSLLLPTGAQMLDGAPATSRTSGTGTALSGTWRCMGTRTLASGSNTYNATLWLRIS